MANKKITELPLIQRVSGSVGYGINDLKSVIPIVVAGTTTQMIVEDFSKFVNAYNAHTGSAGNTFKGPQTIQSTLSVTGNASVGGNLVVAGRITAEEFHTEITTASVIYASGSTKFGDDTGDKHEFTGSINVSGSLIYNGVTLLNLDANTINRLQQATASLQAFTASQDSRNFVLGIVTGSINQATQSLQTFTASQADRNFVLSIVTGSINQATASLQQATASIQLQTASLLAFTASQDSRNFTLSQVTGSFRGEIGGLEEYSASLKAAAIVSSSTQIQNYDVFALNSVLYIATGSIKGEIAGIEAYTASLKSAAIVSSSTQIQNYDLFALNSNLYISTGSLIGITNGLMAFTAALDSTYATDEQLYQLYQATRSLELHSGSMIGITNGLMEYTASLKGQAIVSSSTQIQNYDVFALNSNLYNGTGSIKGEIAGIEAYTASLKGQAIVSSSTQVQNYDLFALNSNLYISTGSLIGITNGLMAYTASNETWKDGVRGEVNGIEAYTASLKAAAIVSSSTQVQNYDLFALNSNLYTSTGSIKGEIAGIEAYTASLKSAISVSGTNVQIIGDLNVNKLNVQYISSSVLVTSGSNIFGDQSTDKHEFTGSVHLQNSLILGTEVLGNAGLNAISASTRIELNSIEEYTASLKTAAIVSSSQQITEYNTFAVTSSANTFYGDQTITGSLAINDVATNFLIEGNGFSQTYLTSNGAIVLNPGYGGVEMVGSYKTFKADDITADGTLLVKGSTTLGDNSADTTTISGSLLVSGSSHTIQSGYVILQQVSQSLNFVDDAAAAAGGVPLGGLYRNGNFIVIRIV
jgi:uncharacterized protein YuzE